MRESNARSDRDFNNFFNPNYMYGIVGDDDVKNPNRFGGGYKAGEYEGTLKLQQSGWVPEWTIKYLDYGDGVTRVTSVKLSGFVKVPQQGNGRYSGFVEKDGNYYFEGVKVIPRSYMVDNTAMGIPEEIYIHPDALFNKNGEPDINLLRHELGHILQYRRYGWSFFLVVAPTSAYSLASNPENHKNTWTEKEASTLSYIYFGQPTDWDHENNPIDKDYMMAVIEADVKKFLFGDN